MPAAKRVATLNLGMQTVTMAVFESAQTGELVITAVAQAELAEDPSADASRPGQLKIALDELRSKLKWTDKTVGIAIPSQGVFTRFVKIPKVEPERAGQMLVFEAQQNVPYPIEEVSWAYQILPEAEPDKLGAIILATKLDNLEATLAAVQSANLHPQVIETSPAALFNSLRYNYPNLPGCTLLVDIGARTTNLIFAEAEKVFIRTLPVGGSSITVALQKRFEMDNLPQAEQLKRKHALIPPPGNFEASGEAAEIGKVARTVMTRIHNEITRSITFYRTTQGGSAPVQLLIAGGGTSLPYTLEFFNEKLSVPVEYFNPLRRVSISPGADRQLLTSCAHSLGECSGLAARLLTADCPLQIALQSPSLERASMDRRRRPFLIATVVLLAATLAGLFYHFRVAADRLAELNSQLVAETGTLQSFKDTIDAAAKQRVQLLQQSADLVAAPFLRTAWAAVLDEIGQRIPARNIWITGLRPMSGEITLARSDKGSQWSSGPAGQETPGADPSAGDSSKPASGVTAIAVEGLYLENESGPAVIDAFVEALAESEVFAIDPDKKNDLIKLRTAQSGDAWAYGYTLVLPLRKPIPL